MRKYRLHRFQKQITQIILLLAICYLPLTISYAAVPHLINYQGRLTDANGIPLNGSYDITLRIYDAEAAGNLLWQETHLAVLIQKGIFSILLGSVTSLYLPFDKAYFLEIKVGSEVMSPRQRITAAGYSIRAEKAEDANTVGTFSVSTTPAPNSLLVLDGNGNMPAGQGLLGNNIVVLSGVISDGGTIPLPAGYTEDQCKWLVSYANTSRVMGPAMDGWLWIQCYTTGRVVTCNIGGTGPGGGYYPTDANYIIIGVK